MKQLENYHYAAYLFSLALFSNEVEVTRKIEGKGPARNVYYNISSKDKKYNENFIFFKIPKDKNPYKRELCELISYISTVKDFKFPKKFKNDKDLLERYLYLINNVFYMNDVDMIFAGTDAELQRLITKINKPYTTINDWRTETENNFLPMCREHIILFATEVLTAEIMKAQGKIKPEHTDQSIDKALTTIGVSQDNITEMRKMSAKLPPDTLPQPQ